MRINKTRLRAAFAMLARAGADARRRRLRQQRRQHDSSSTEGGEGGGAIVSNPDNGKVSLTIGSKNFPEQEILGEIYAQALAAAGYKVKSDLNLGSETVALQSGEVGADLRLPGVRQHGPHLVLRPRTRRSPRRRHRAPTKKPKPNSKRKA